MIDKFFDELVSGLNSLADSTPSEQSNESKKKHRSAQLWLELSFH
jgi:hypothetical protein